MNDDLAPLLSTLPEPVTPSSMTATVMARIEREASAPRAEAVAPAPGRPVRDSFTWLTASLGIVLAFGAFASGWYSHGVPDVFAPQLLRGGLEAALIGWPAMLVGGAGVALCVHALFAPLRSRQR